MGAGRIGITVATDALGIGADGIGTGMAMILAVDFFGVFFFEVGILHSCFFVEPATRSCSPC
jgi:hypothetical protein